MKQLAGIVFIYKKNQNLEVWLGKRIRAPFRHYWAMPVEEIMPGQSAWDVAIRKVREELNVYSEPWLQHRNAIKISQFKYKIPFLYRLEMFIIAIRDKAMIDDQLHFAGNYDETGWYSVDDLPPKTHLSVHYAMGLIDTEKMSLEPDFFSADD